MKNLIIAAVIGTAFMAGGFWYGMRVAPKPPKAKEAAAQANAAGATAAAPAPDAISIETLRKTSETMMTLNQALQVREQNVAERERKVKEKEDELAAERQALDRTHEKFKVLFNEFQDRLQLVEASQMEQLQKQAELYTSMSLDQSIDLMRAMDEASMTRLFSVMDTKPLSKIMAQWKAKYPADGPRLLRVLNGMAEVLPKEKIALSDPTTTSGSGKSGSSTPSSTPDTSAPNSPAPADSSAPSSAPATTPESTSSTAPSLAPPPDPASSPDSNPVPALPTPPDSVVKNPVSTATTN